jgi:hypothetical protein
MISIRKVAAVAAVASLIGGCNAIRYVEPTQGPATARVRFATDAESPAVLRVYDDPACKTNEQEWLRIWTGTQIRAQPKRLGIPLWNYTVGSAKEVVVSSDKELDGMFFGGARSRQRVQVCAVPFTLRPQAGHDYEVFFHWFAAACEVFVSEVGGGDQPEKLPGRIFHNEVNSTNSDCLAAFYKTRLY